LFVSAAIDDLAPFDLIATGAIQAPRDPKMNIKKKKKRSVAGMDDDDELYDDDEMDEDMKKRGWDYVYTDENGNTDEDDERAYRALTDAFADENDLFEDNEDEAALRRAQRDAEAGLLTAACLVEVILTRERKRKETRLSDLAEEDPMAFLILQSKQKGIKGVDEVIAALVYDLKVTLKQGIQQKLSPESIKEISIANLTFMMYVIKMSVYIYIYVYFIFVYFNFYLVCFFLLLLLIAIKVFHEP
jgi:hypothetical protein